MSEKDLKKSWTGRKYLFIYAIIFGLLAVVILIAQKSDVKIGNTDISELSKETLSQKEQNIYNEIVESWDKVSREVNEKYPLEINRKYPPEYLEERQGYNKKLKNKYYSEIADKHDLSANQMDSILKRGSLL